MPRCSKKRWSSATTTARARWREIARPSTQRYATLAHGWPVAEPGAYPWLQHRDRDGLLRPLEERDLDVMTACASALAAFFVKHGPLFERERFAPVCEAFFDQDDLELRFTVPYEAAEQFEVNIPPPRPAAPRWSC